MSEDVCPFCKHDPYHYVDIGVGYERVAVTCCDLGIALFQDGDELVSRVAAHIERIEALNAELREALETADRLLEQYRPLDDIEACQTFPEDRTPDDEALLFDRSRVRAALASATPTTEGAAS